MLQPPLRPMRLLTELIALKRDGGRIPEADWGPLMRAYAAGDVPDYQMAALVMACFLRGLDAGETVALATAMLESGRTLDLSHLGKPRVDKHSTGGWGTRSRWCSRRWSRRAGSRCR